jgi:hypothetical protein
MDFVKILRSAEEFVFLVGAWIILAPKTLFRVLIRSEWIYDYVRSEGKKAPEERYQAYVSPVVFWVLFAVIPPIAVFDYYFSFSHAEADAKFLNLGLETLVVISTFVLIGMPIGIAAAHNLFLRLPNSRASLEPMFLAQCYCVAPFELCFVPGLVRALAGSFDRPLPLSGRFWYVFLIAGVVWLLQAETRMLRVVCKTSVANSLGRALLYTLIGWLLMVVLTLPVIWGLANFI